MIVPFMGAGIKVLKYHIYGSRYQIVPFMGTGIKALYRKEQCSILHIVPFMGMGIKSRAITERWIWRVKAVWLPLSASSK